MRKERLTITAREVEARVRAQERTWYINREGQGQRETIGEYASKPRGSATTGAVYFVSQKYVAEKEVIQYQLSDPSARYWVSPRPCANWKDD